MGRTSHNNKTPNCGNTLRRRTPSKVFVTLSCELCRQPLASEKAFGENRQDVRCLVFTTEWQASIVALVAKQAYLVDVDFDRWTAMLSFVAAVTAVVAQTFEHMVNNGVRSIATELAEVYLPRWL